MIQHFVEVTIEALSFHLQQKKNFNFCFKYQGYIYANTSHQSQYVH